MTAKNLEIRGTVTWLGVGHTFGSLLSSYVEKIEVRVNYGVVGDRHASDRRLLDARELTLLKYGCEKGTEIANMRHWSMVSAEELEQIADRMKFPDITTPPGTLGENITVSGIPKLTELPPGTLLFFERKEGGLRSTVLAVWSENLPCELPGTEIAKKYPGIKNLASRFPKAAMGRRGLVGFVYRSGKIYVGDTVIVVIPAQRVYEPK